MCHKITIETLYKPYVSKILSTRNQVPLEMHKVRVIQKLNLLPVEERLRAIQQAGCNTFLLQNKDIYLDMLTDSGVNAMSDRQTAAMHVADDAYAGSETFNRLKAAMKEVFGTDNVLPAIRVALVRIFLPSVL